MANGQTPNRPTVLVVDDEPANLDLLFRTLRKDYEVLRASSGAEALAHLKSHPEIRLVLTDQLMPEMTGVEMLYESLDLAPEAARIVLTGYTDYQAVLDAIDNGYVDRLVMKPIEPEKLLSLVKEALDFEARS
jgi:response regulator RpfG family c-di-GMP phosphodiesterase